MTTTVLATYDGEVLRPHGPLPVPPDTEVRITVEAAAGEPEPADDTAYSFLDVAESLNLQGPPDWSKRLDDHMQGPRSDHAP